MMKASKRNLPIVVALLIGIGMIAAPVVFQMFDRAPLGGEMIDDFAPYMTIDEVELFRGYLDEIGAANAESIDVLRTDLVTAGSIDDGSLRHDVRVGREPERAMANHPRGHGRPDRSDGGEPRELRSGRGAAPISHVPVVLRDPRAAHRGRGIRGARVRRSDRPGRARPAVWTLLVLGLAVAAAPVMFQMFSRAPQGAEMIDDFRPMMTRERVQSVQGYFVTLGAAEGQLRVTAVPMSCATRRTIPQSHSGLLIGRGS